MIRYYDLISYDSVSWYGTAILSRHCWYSNTCLLSDLRWIPMSTGIIPLSRLAKSSNFRRHDGVRDHFPFPGHGTGRVRCRVPIGGRGISKSYIAHSVQYHSQLFFHKTRWELLSTQNALDYIASYISRWYITPTYGFNAITWANTSDSGKA